MTAESLDDLVARLRDLSKSATEGPYFRQTTGVYLAEGGMVCETRCVGDANYFAAIPPETVTALLDEIVALRARADELEKRIPTAAVADMQSGLQTEIAHLYASLKDEREAHAQLQARCFDYGGTGQNVFSDLARYQEDRLVIEAERNALSAEVVALREDAERYRWLRHHGCGHEAVSENDHGIDVWLGNEALDQAIDSARLAEKDRGG